MYIFEKGYRNMNDTNITEEIVTVAFERGIARATLPPSLPSGIGRTCSD